METNKNIKRPKPVVLVILDGWGIAPPYSGNAITRAKLPNITSLVERFPITALSASGEAVGLRWGEMGNSEVGHLNIGAGRIVYQDFPRINKAISDNSFLNNTALVSAIDHVKKYKSKLHACGLLTNGGIHAAMEHLIALLAFAKEHKVQQLYLHLFLDGRDMQFNSGQKIIEDVEKKIVEYGIGKIATLAGRFYAMDRDNHWDRIEPAFKAMSVGESENKFSSASEAIEASYQKKVYDEEFVPAVITNGSKPVATVDKDDSIIFFNFRADRARQLTKAFVLPSFAKFSRQKDYSNLHFVSMTEYEKNLPLSVAFPPVEVANTLGQVFAENNLKQLRIAETEKYAHVTYFFNGGKEEAVAGESRVVIPSVNVESYADSPKMSAADITSRLKKELNKNIYDFVLVNYANADMVAHTGNMDAAITALEYLDKVLGELATAILDRGGVILVTADHGNAEEMFNMKTGSIAKEHSVNPVPLIIIGKQYEGVKLTKADIDNVDLSVLQPQGILADVAPTILKIMNIKKPPEMSGRALI